MFKFTNVQTNCRSPTSAAGYFHSVLEYPEKAKCTPTTDMAHQIHIYETPWKGRLSQIKSMVSLEETSRPHLEGLKHVLWGTENTVNQPKLAGLQYGHTPLISLQKRVEGRVLWLLQKILQCPCKLSYKIMFYYTELKHSSLSQVDVWSWSLLCEGP